MRKEWYIKSINKKAVKALPDQQYREDILKSLALEAMSLDQLQAVSFLLLSLEIMRDINPGGQ